MVDKFKKAIIYDKDLYDNILDDPKSNIGYFFDRFLLILVLIFPFVMVFESVGNNATIYTMELLYFDSFLSSAFMLEYVYRFFKVKKKLHFLISPLRLIDLLSFLPFFLGLFAVGDFLKVLRVLRVLRILRLLKRIPLTAGFINSLKNYSSEYRAVFTLYLIILFLGSFFVFILEKDLEGTKFTSVGNALWWGIVTMTTVGYGDVAPISALGKIIGSILVFLGPVIGALTGAVTIMVFMEGSNNDNIINKHTKVKECSRCRTINPKEANYCMRCGNEFPKLVHGKILIKEKIQKSI